MAWTMQRIYNKVKRHLLKQNKRSGNNWTCLYRGPNGLKCAIGCLIPNKLYTPKLEDLGVNTPSVARVLLRAGIVESTNRSNKVFDLMMDLQDCHDNDNVSNWRNRLTQIANHYNLKP